MPIGRVKSCRKKASRFRCAHAGQEKSIIGCKRNKFDPLFNSKLSAAYQPIIFPISGNPNFIFTSLFMIFSTQFFSGPAPTPYLVCLEALIVYMIFFSPTESFCSKIKTGRRSMVFNQRQCMVYYIQYFLPLQNKP